MEADSRIRRKRRRQQSSISSSKNKNRIGVGVLLFTSCSLQPTFILHASSSPIIHDDENDVVTRHHLRHVRSEEAQYEGLLLQEEVSAPINSENDNQPLEERKLIDQHVYQNPDSWYTDWPRFRCVQSCEPTPSNPHCAGLVAWNEHLFDTAEFCCQVTLNWLTFEECTSTGGSEEIAEMSSNLVVANASSAEEISTANLEEEETATTDDCPYVYDHTQTYTSGSLVTLYENEVGNVYICKDGPLSAYCNLFGPHWRREADGGGSIHQDEGYMGWEFVEICTGIETLNSKVETTTTEATKPSKVTKPKETGTMYSYSQAGCWRHGRRCDSHADQFACCGYCLNGYCWGT